MNDAIPLLHDGLIDSARRLPGKVALVCRKQRVTYAEIDARSTALAHALVARGVKRGDRVVVFADNTPETVVSFWAILKANAVVSIVNPLTKTDKLTYLLNDCRAAALITDAHLGPVFLEATGRAPHLATVVVSGLAEDLRGRVAGFVAWDEALATGAGAGLAPPRRSALDVDLAAIIYTSGSSGDPKGVMLTHRNMLTAATSRTT